MFSFFVEPGSRGEAGNVLNESIVTVRDSKLWIDEQDLSTRQPRNAAHHPFTGFYLEYPDSNRSTTQGLVSTITRDPPMLDWIDIDKDSYEVKYSNRSGSIAHHIGSFDWTIDSNEDSYVVFDDWEG